MKLDQYFKSSKSNFFSKILHFSCSNDRDRLFAKFSHNNGQIDSSSYLFAYNISQNIAYLV